MKKVGIITWHQYHNFGSALQAAALRITITNLGFDATIIDYRPDEKYNCIKVILRDLIGEFTTNYLRSYTGKYRYSFSRFQSQYMNLSKHVTFDMLPIISSAFDVVICGSDQIWAPNVFNPVYMLDFVDGKRTKKISYAASIGLKAIPDSLAKQYKNLLEDFHAISVREETGRELLKNQIGIDSTTVLDPTLLVNKDIYDTMEESIDVGDKPYIFCYFLNSTHNYKDRVLEFAKQRNLRLIGVSFNNNDSNWMQILQYIGPCEFLKLIDSAEVVMTDSYHGTIFSLLFHKEFYTFERFMVNDPINQNSRIYQLDKMFSIQEHIISSNTNKIEPRSYDYKVFEELLNNERERSFAYLREALK